MDEEKKRKECSGFPLDDLIEEDEVEPIDEWEKREADRKEKAARLLAKTIMNGSLDSEDSIVKSIKSFYNTANILRSI